MPIAGTYSPIYAAIANPQVGEHLTYDGNKWVNSVAVVAPHTIASHSDTTATGVELETLTDGSNADSLHIHSAPFNTRTFVVDTDTTKGSYQTIQAAIDAAELLTLTADAPAIILIPNGYWNENVVIRKSYVHLIGQGGQGAIRINKITYTNATTASIATYESTDDPNDLVAQTQTDIPWDNQIRSIEIWDKVSNAQASLRFLGSGTGTSFLGNELLLIDTTVRASGASQNGLAVDGVLANYYSNGDYCWIAGKTRLRNVTGYWPLGGQISALDMEYDSAATYGEPSDTGNYGLAASGCFINGLVTLTKEGNIGGGDRSEGHHFVGGITITGTGTSNFYGDIRSNISVGTGCTFNHYGDILGIISGAGTYNSFSANAITFLSKNVDYVAGSELTRRVIIEVDATAGNIIITLPLLSKAKAQKREYDIKKIDNSVNTVTIDGNGAEILDGQLTQVLDIQYENLTVVPGSTEWLVR